VLAKSLYLFKVGCYDHIDQVSNDPSSKILVEPGLGYIAYWVCWVAQLIRMCLHYATPVPDRGVVELCRERRKSFNRLRSRGKSTSTSGVTGYNGYGEPSILRERPTVRFNVPEPHVKQPVKHRPSPLCLALETPDSYHSSDEENEEEKVVELDPPSAKDITIGSLASDAGKAKSTVTSPDEEDDAFFSCECSF